ncbi:MAG: signal recognition particle-docking protein FtsY [Pseudomonadota bacterium]|nr:signal recognition particle-docking protein FtsY [Pseudomonadota bacterium]
MFRRLKAGIARTRDGLARGINRLFAESARLDAKALEELENVLLQADVGVAATERIVQGVRNIRTDDTAVSVIRREMSAILKPCEQGLVCDSSDDTPFVILVVGVNGVGKTTTIAKITRMLQAQGRSVMLAAGDTFRAAAVEQLNTWGERLQVPVIAQSPGADSASVIYDACAAARKRGIDVLIADTAGRLHTQDNLMAELVKVKRVIAKYDAKAPQEVLLVVDATMGQNAINQAQKFCAAVDVTGLCLTKLDGTAKGGVIFALAERFGLPIRFIGVGEQDRDLQPFVADDFTRALLGDFGATVSESAK